MDEMLRRTSLALRMHYPCGTSLPYVPYEKSINSGNFFVKAFASEDKTSTLNLWKEKSVIFACHKKLLYGQGWALSGRKSIDNVANSGSGTYIFPP